MGLDLSKAEDRKPLLGRGRIPEEVKRRLQGDKTEPEDERVARLHARTRRLKREGTRLDDYLSKSLNEVGGKWENPETWQPKSPSQRRAWEQYTKRLEEERNLHPAAIQVAAAVRQEFVETHSVAVANGISVFRDPDLNLTSFCWGVRKHTVPDEMLVGLDTGDVQHLARVIAQALAKQP